MLNGAMLVWFVLTGLSLLFVLWDSLTNGVTSWVQRIAWILVTAYTGVFGLFFYLVTCRRPFPGGHDRFTQATWKQAVNSEMHCLAGDATGILLAAIAVSSLGLANGWDITVEYLAGFIKACTNIRRTRLYRKHPGETAGVFELILGGAPLGSQLDCRRVSTDGGGLCGLISLLGRRPVPGE